MKFRLLSELLNYTWTIKLGSLVCKWQKKAIFIFYRFIFYSLLARGCPVVSVSPSYECHYSSIHCYSFCRVSNWFPYTLAPHFKLVFLHKHQWALDRPLLLDFRPKTVWMCVLTLKGWLAKRAAVQAHCSLTFQKGLFFLPLPVHWISQNL